MNTETETMEHKAPGKGIKVAKGVGAGLLALCLVGSLGLNVYQAQAQRDYANQMGAFIAEQKERWAKAEEQERILGLDIGADDYVIKPFSPREVLMRVKTVLRRVADESVDEKSKKIEVAGLVIDMNSYEASVNGKPVILTKKEIEILWLFATNPGRVFTRDHLLENIWGYEYFGDTRTVDTHIKRIRTKLDSDDSVVFDIKTVWGVGYKFEVK